MPTNQKAVFLFFKLKRWQKPQEKYAQINSDDVWQTGQSGLVSKKLDWNVLKSRAKLFQEAKIFFARSK